MSKQTDQPRIRIKENGPYVVQGNVPLRRKSQVVSEHGEPLTWRTNETIDTEGKSSYSLCRCGASGNKPFCDGTHREIGFDGAESAKTNTTAERQVVHEGGTGIVVKRDYHLCMSSGFCGNRKTNIEEMTKHTDESIIRAQIMAMVDRCPSGSYTYALEPGGENIEPDLPVEIAVTSDITDEGPVAGALWLTGGIPVERSDSEFFETRNRVALCRCGLSDIKPLCNGAHRKQQVEEEYTPPQSISAA